MTLAIASLLTSLGPAPYAMAEVDIVEVDREMFEVPEIEFELFNPKRIRPMINGQEHVRLCLMNTDVTIGCDLPPNGSLDLTFPINARFTVKGKYLLLADNDGIGVIPGATEILLWQQAGNDPAIEKGKLRARTGEPARNFQDYIVTSYISSDGEIFTVFSFNIPREDAYFGPASDFQHSGGSFVEADDNKLNWSFSMRLLKDESDDPRVCEFLKMVNGSDDCLIPQYLLASSEDYLNGFRSPFFVPKVSFVY